MGALTAAVVTATAAQKERYYKGRVSRKQRWLHEYLKGYLPLPTSSTAFKHPCPPLKIISACNCFYFFLVN